MPQYQITTLTPLHIGSGRLISPNFEYLHFEQEKCLVVIDEAKVLTLIGTENLDRWMSIIDKGEDLLGYLRQRKPNLSPEEVAERIIPIAKGTKLRSGNEFLPMREQLHTVGKPLLPGSSTKGSLRTALLTKMLRDSYPTPVLNPASIPLGKEKNRKGERFFEFEHDGIQRKYMGGSPNEDVGRLLQVRDVVFGKTEVHTGVFANLKGYTWEIDSRQQLLECVPAGENAIFDLSQPSKLMQLLDKPPFPINNPFDRVQAAYQQLKKLPDFLRLCHAHTLDLLQIELTHWDKERDNAKVNTTKIDLHIEQLEDLYAAAKALNPAHEVLLRIGFGSGLKGMTGDWQEDVFDDDTQEMWLAQLDRRDVGLFPKTRKMTHNQQPLGFVKLSF